MKTIIYKIYGIPGHRQRQSFFPSIKYDFSTKDYTRIIEQFNSDRTNTNDFTIIKITCNTKEQCINELNGQISDGIFENCRTGKTGKITQKQLKQILKDAEK